MTKRLITIEIDELPDGDVVFEVAYNGYLYTTTQGRALAQAIEDITPGIKWVIARASQADERARS